MRTGIITQARMTSTRLPGKILLKAGGRPLLDYHVDRARWSDLEVIVATTTNAEDDPVVDFCKKRSLPFFRGSEHDVLSRYHLAAREHGLETVIRITSDCPLIDGSLIRRGLELYEKQANPRTYLSNTLDRTFARGFDFEIFSFGLLEEAASKARQDFEREHVTPFINRHPSNQILAWKTEENHSDYRITVDEPDDFKLLKILLEDEFCMTKSWRDITKLLQSRPDLRAINAHVLQKLLPPSEKT